MARARQFVKCGICGTHGHIDTKCALYELNCQQEGRTAVQLENIKLGLTPELELQIQRIRDAWSLTSRIAIA